MERPPRRLLPLTLTLLAACAMTTNDDAKAAPAPRADAELPDWRPLWDFDDPDATELRLRELLPAAEAEAAAGRATYLAVVLSQLARTYGLRGRFDEGHALAGRVEGLLADCEPEARVRYELERGRLFNSGGDKAEASAHFQRAWDLGRAAGLDGLALDAAHMQGIALPPERALEWSRLAIDLAERSDDQRLKGWLGPLYNNTGWTLLEGGDPAGALVLWEKGLAFRRAAGDPEPILIARYTVARAWRALGRTTEALAEQRAVWDAREAAGLAPDGFVAEEIAEGLLATGRAEEATAWFARAFEQIGAFDWLKESEPERYARLERLAGGG